MKIKDQIRKFVTDRFYVSSPESLAHVAEMAVKLFPGPIIEIGGGNGHITKELLKVAKRYNRMVYVVDPYSLAREDAPLSHGAGGGYTLESLMKSVRSVGGESHFKLIQESSQDLDRETIRALGDLSFAFVDGLQYADAVTNDLYLVSQCPVIAVDDYKRHTELSQVASGVAKFVNESSDEYEMIIDTAIERSRVFLVHENMTESDEDKLDSLNWGGSGIERVVFEFILKTIPQGSKILELGAGYCSTHAFSMFYKPYSVDDNINYIGLYDNVTYVLAPRKNGGWYDKTMIESIPKDYSMIFVDGPSGHSREGILDNLDLLDLDVPMIFHDTNRKPERDLAIAVAERMGKEIVFYDDGDFWGVIK
jgi:hypothetical protein